MHKHIQNAMPETLNSLFTLVSAYTYKSQDWLHLRINFTCQDIEQTSAKKFFQFFIIETIPHLRLNAPTAIILEL